MTAEQREAKNAAGRAHFAQMSVARRARKSALARAWYARNPAVGMLAAAKRKRGGVPVTITVADILVPATCPVCGVLMTTGQARANDRSPSLDRYDPALGYVPGNIMVICRGCNRRKQNHTGEQLIALGQAIIAAKAAYDKATAATGA